MSHLERTLGALAAPILIVGAVVVLVFVVAYGLKGL